MSRAIGPQFGVRLQQSLRSGLQVLGFIAGWAMAERVDWGPGGLHYLICLLVGWQLGEFAKRAWPTPAERSARSGRPTPRERRKNTASE